MSILEGLARHAAMLAALTIVSIGVGHAGKPGGPAPEGPKSGRPATPFEIGRLDLTISGNGEGLPAGSGTVEEGRATYAAKCQACHGPAGRGGVADRLTGGIGTLASPKPVRTVASYWPYAPTLFDYIRRAMPLTAPQSLTDDEVYGLTAYLLSIDSIVRGDVRLDAAALARVRMPNRDGFVRLDRADFDGNPNGPGTSAPHPAGR